MTNYPHSSDAPDDLDIPIALRKGVKSCTQHPIPNFISYDRLSPRYYAFVTNMSNVEIPKSIREALQKPEWKQTIGDKIKAIKKNGTWKLLDLHKGKYPVGCKWIFTIKYKPVKAYNSIKPNLLLRDLLKHMI